MDGAASVAASQQSVGRNMRNSIFSGAAAAALLHAKKNTIDRPTGKCADRYAFLVRSMFMLWVGRDTVIAGIVFAFFQR